MDKDINTVIYDNTNEIMPCMATAYNIQWCILSSLLILEITRYSIIRAYDCLKAFSSKFAVFGCPLNFQLITMC